MLSIVLEARSHMVSLATSISVLTWSFLLQKPQIDASRTMSSGIIKLVVVGHYFIWHARVLTDVDMDAVVSGQQQVTAKGEHMNVAQVSHGSEKIS